MQVADRGLYRKQGSCLTVFWPKFYVDIDG